MKRLKSFLNALIETSKKMVSYVSRHTFLSSSLVFLFFFVVFMWVYFSVTTLVSGDDHFFHIRFAQMIRLHGFHEVFSTFKSLYLSKIAAGQYLIYYNFLFYLALIPFTFITPLYLGIKLYAVTSVSLTFTLLYVVLKHLRVRYPFIWTIAIFAVVDSNSLWRFFLSRPYTLAPALLVVLLYFLYKKNYIGVFCMSIVYLYWHSLTFFFPIGIAVTYFIFERVYKRKPDWRSLIASVLGTVAGIALMYAFAPGFLLYIKDIIFGIFWDGRKVFLLEGAEVFPINFYNYIDSNKLLFSALVVATLVEISVYITNRHRLEKLGPSDFSANTFPLRSTAFFISIGFLAGMVIVSGRFADYFVFFTGLYIVLVLTYLWSHLSFSAPFLKKGVVAGLVIMICYLFGSNLVLLQSHIGNNGAPAEEFEGIGNWLSNNTKPGDVVFNASWNWFPQLYYYSPLNNYIIGIEPRFIYSYDAKAYWLWLHMAGNGYVCDVQECPEKSLRSYMMQKNPTTADAWYKEEGEVIAKTLLETFHSSYVMSSYQFKSFNDVLDHSPRFKKVYGGNRVYYIYQILR